MGWTPSLIVWAILAFSSSPACGEPTQGETVLFLGPGTGSDGRSMVLSLPDLAPIPTDMKPLPLWSLSLAAVIDEKLMICGGLPEDPRVPGFSNKCYTLTNGTEWIPAPSMSKIKVGAAATKISERAGGGWWVTGGNDESEDRSTEVFQNGEWQDGPQLPQGVALHCLLQLNWNSYLLVGGMFRGFREGDPLFNKGGTYILRNRGYDPEQIISGVPPIGMGCTCAMLGNEAYVAGGSDPSTASTKVHIFSGSDERDYHDLAWREGPELPAPIYGGSLVAFDNHLYLLGGYKVGGGPGSGSYNDIIYKLDQGEWTAVDSSPHDLRRYNFPALVVPKHIIQ